MNALRAAVERHREALLRRERAAAGRMVRAYGAAWSRISRDLTGLTERIEEARASGEEVSVSWLYQVDRLEALRAAVEREIGEFAFAAEAVVTAEQRAAVEAALADSRELARAALGRAPGTVEMPWNRLPREAVQDLVGALSDGSPLAALLAELPGRAGEGVARALTTGVALGRGPRELAREVRRELGGNLARALTISRTETLRAYRESSRRSYGENSDVVRRWRWHAELGDRTCASCLAMHGTEHETEEALESHVNCRCAMVPVPISWEELGLAGVPDTRPDPGPSGEEWLERQDDGVVAKILGPSGAEAWQRREVSLRDFVHETYSSRWGITRRQASLQDALAAADRRAGRPTVT